MQGTQTGFASLVFYDGGWKQTIIRAPSFLLYYEILSLYARGVRDTSPGGAEGQTVLVIVFYIPYLNFTIPFGVIL